MSHKTVVFLNVSDIITAKASCNWQLVLLEILMNLKLMYVFIRVTLIKICMLDNIYKKLF